MVDPEKTVPVPSGLDDKGGTFLEDAATASSKGIWAEWIIPNSTD